MSMQMVDTLPNSPENVTDISLLADALFTLERLEEEHGRTYVFEYIQQPMIGGTCHPVPEGLPKSNGSRVIATYDKSYFERRIQTLGSTLH